MFQRRPLIIVYSECLRFQGTKATSSAPFAAPTSAAEVLGMAGRGVTGLTNEAGSPQRARKDECVCELLNLHHLTTLPDNGCSKIPFKSRLPSPFAIHNQHKNIINEHRGSFTVQCLQYRRHEQQ